ncbi:lysine--tRNA ligase [Candidatus Woesearchaeota archaeon]|nr:lysine--tRNA ligase [Candidatus Woesearchaeota archaeon]
MKKEQVNKPSGRDQEEDFNLFWADQLADRIIHREKSRYSGKEIRKPSEFVIKTSASISGVLHIGRLSDTIRGATVFRALTDAGAKARLIWVAEDMDPFRKVPEGVPEEYKKYIGFAVTDIPDPEGCHKSYAEHHKERYFEVLHEFVPVEMKAYSTREEYRQGSFNPFIKKLVEKSEDVRAIQNRHRTNPLKPGWCPWTPVCERCGRIVTARVTTVSEGMVSYACKDYMFETTTAEGCGFKGTSDPMKGNGKLLWKSEWAAEWAFWKVSCEGAGKEYIVPNSAFWINAEIAEKVLDYPAPEPMFYEHLMVDGVKMSASLGNVIYPHDWLEVARPNLLAFFYNKRLMMTRSFSWKELPALYDEFDDAARVYVGQKKLDNQKEAAHIMRHYEVSCSGHVEKPVGISFSHAAMLAQVFDSKEGYISSLRKTGHYSGDSEEAILRRIAMAKVWVSKYAPDSDRYVLQDRVAAELSQLQKKAVREVVRALKSREWDEKTLFLEFYEISKKVGIDPKDFFKAGYLVLLNKERGPKLAPFVLALGDRALRLLEQV